MSFFIQLLFNLIVLIFILIGTQNFDYITVFLRSGMILNSCLMLFVNTIYFMYIQFNYLKNLS
jgi:hypothetical protein